MIIPIILAVIAVVCLIYSITAFQKKGPLLTTIYLLANPEQRSKMKTKSNYIFVAVAFLIISVMFFLASVGTFLNLSWMYNVIIGLAFILIIYAIAFSIRSETKNK